MPTYEYFISCKLTQVSLESHSRLTYFRLCFIKHNFVNIIIEIAKLTWNTLSFSPTVVGVIESKQCKFLYFIDCHHMAVATLFWAKRPSTPSLLLYCAGSKEEEEVVSAAGSDGSIATDHGSDTPSSGKRKRVDSVVITVPPRAARGRIARRPAWLSGSAENNNHGWRGGNVHRGWNPNWRGGVRSRSRGRHGRHGRFGRWWTGIHREHCDWLSRVSQPTVKGFNVFFYLPQDGITCQPTDGFFYFLSLKSEKLKKEVLLLGLRRFYPPLDWIHTVKICLKVTGVPFFTFISTHCFLFYSSDENRERS